MKCNKCKHTWRPRVDNPKICPACKCRLGKSRQNIYVKSKNGEPEYASFNNVRGSKRVPIK